MLDDPLNSEPGQTPLAESERGDLVPSIFSQADLNALELENIDSARRWATSRRVLARHDPLSDSFTRELHRRMFFRVWRWAGIYRTTPKNLGFEAHRIPQEVRIALDDARYWLENKTYPADEAAIRLHYRMVLIHPWSNGNGRHARLLADTLLKARNEPPLSWGGNASQLLSLGNMRRRYVESLQRADEHDYGPLLRFCR
jgi:Fic-DOC domain mobile mystery protein B